MSTSESNKRVLRLDPRDNALVALTDLRQGEHVNLKGEDYLLLSDVPAKHKFLTQDLPADGDVTMYGVLVGKTSQPLRRGDLLSTRNLRHAAAAFHDKGAALVSSGRLALARQDISRLPPRRRTGRHQKLLDCAAAGFLREPQPQRAEAGV